MGTYVKTLFTLLLLGVLLLSSCTKTGHDQAGCSEILNDSILVSYNDSMITHPQATIKTFTKIRESLSDSIDSYSLTLAIASCWLFAGNVDSAIIVGKKVIQYCEREEPTTCLLIFKADAYLKYGTYWDSFGQRDSMQVYYQKAYNVIMSGERRLLLPPICYGLGIGYHKKGDYPMASYYQRRALFAADSLHIGHMYNHLIFTELAKLYSEIENYDLAEYYFQQAEPYLEKEAVYNQYSYTSLRGTHYFNIKDYPKALNWFRQCYQIVLASFPQPNYLTITEISLGETFLKMGLVDSAHYYIEQAKKNYDQPSYQEQENRLGVNSVSAALALQENRIYEAEKLLSQPYDMTLMESQSIYKYNLRLEELYAKKNDYKNAYKYRLKVNAYNDSLRNTKVRNHIAEIDMRYKQDTTLLRKDLRIAAVEGRASRWQSVASVSISSLVLLFALAGAFVLYTRRKREQEYHRQVTTVTGLRMEIVRNRLSPHFMFNALNAVMPSLNQHKELEQPFGLLIQMLRDNLCASEQIAVPWEEEVKLVKNYLQLQMLGEPGRIQVEWQVAEDVPAGVGIPSMAIQIPVENAVKYAFVSGQADARIDIRITRQTDSICIVIEDNGVGYNPAPGAFNERGTGNGLKMLHRTVELLNEQNRRQMKFTIENRRSTGTSMQGTCVTIIVPLDYHFEMS